MPRILHGGGILGAFYTDVCASRGIGWVVGKVPRALRPPVVRKLAERNPGGIPTNLIRTFDLFGLEYAFRVARARSAGERLRAYLWGGTRFCELVARAGAGQYTGVHAFNGAGLELIRAARNEGRSTVLEQTIAPFSYRRRLLEEERLLHPGWERTDNAGVVGDEFEAREREEWESADVILCGSEFVRSSIGLVGGAVEKCVTVPYGFDPSSTTFVRPAHGGPLRVLTVGTVGLRKGLPYVLRAAQRTARVAEFRVVGEVEVTEFACRELRSVLTLIGHAPRGGMRGHYEWADVFLLPSICEGSAGAVYEALTYGLPVICTPNTGSVIRDGVDGFVVGIRDVDAIVHGLERLVQSVHLLQAMSENARRRAADFTLEQYGRRLLRVVQGEVSDTVPRS